MPREYIQDLAIWLFIGGLIGARITFLCVGNNLVASGRLLTQFHKIWDGGIVLYGSVIGGLAAYLGHDWFLILRKTGVSDAEAGRHRGSVDCGGPVPGAARLLPQRLLLRAGRLSDLSRSTRSLPLSAGAEGLVDRAIRQPPGFTLAEDQPPNNGVRVEQVDPNSEAHAAGFSPRQTDRKSERLHPC